MPFEQMGELRVFRFETLGNHVIQGIFTRHGGVSPSPWETLNLGGTVGDERINVIENRARVFSAVGLPMESMFDVWQVHGTEVACADAPRLPDESYIQADSILTDKPRVTLMMRFADCVPILLYDPGKNVVGIVHAGWLGTVRKAAAAAVQKMQSHYGSNPGDILAGIGPAIGPDHYEVGMDVVDSVKEAFGHDASIMLNNQNGKTYFDLWKANQITLEQSGLRSIEVACICTACNIHDWYSHRGERGKTGRFGGLIALRSD